MNILENSVFLMTNDLQKQRLRTFVDLHVYATPNSIIKNQTMYNSTFTQFKKKHKNYLQFSISFEQYSFQEPKTTALFRHRKITINNHC